MEWKPYDPCCHTSALDENSGFCGECGKVLVRCIAFSECKSLVRPHRHCEVCIDTSLSIDPGTVTAATIGQRLSIPLVLANASGVGRPIWVTGAALQLGGQTFQAIPLMWERIDPGEQRIIYAETGALEAGGTGTISVAITLSSRYKGYEENYTFGGAVQFRVNAATDGKIIQNIDFSGATLGTGTLVNTKLEADTAEAHPITPSNDKRVLIPFGPMERYELENGVRGYQATKARIPRTVEFDFKGFPTGHTPSRPIGIGQKGVLVFGRNLRQFDAEQNPDPSDITLRVMNAHSGELDRDMTMGVSRRHFDLVVLNERLYIHMRSGNGGLLNGTEIATAQLVPVGDNDIISPIVNQPDLISIQVRFRSRPDGVVETVQLCHEPAITR